MLRSLASTAGGRLPVYKTRIGSGVGRKRGLVPQKLSTNGKLLSTRLSVVGASGSTIRESPSSFDASLAANTVPGSLAVWPRNLPNPLGAVVPLQCSPQVILPIASLRAVRVQSRWMSTSGGGGRGNSKPESPAEAQAASSEEVKTVGTATPASSTPISAQFENRIKKVVTDLNLGDQLAVSGILLLLAFIGLGPFVVQKMKQSDSTYEDLMTDDPVDDFVVSQQWGDLEKRNPVENLLKDVLQSKALQKAAQQFVISIMESTEFKAALNRLVKELWRDLVEDPETLQQIIKVLQVAIQDKAILKAAQTLVMDLVDEPEVKAALIQMIQRLGTDQAVQGATQSLITESAHNVLNDAEILDHSMEFATDVLGDDIVQRTAGEALRNTVGHAFRPTSTIVLTATGVGLLLFGVVAIGYAKSSDQEARLFETAARSMQTNATYGMVQIVTWPGRAIQWAVRVCGYCLSYPFVVLQSSLVQLGGAVGSRVQRTSRYATGSVARFLIATGQACSSRLERSRRHVSNWLGVALQGVAQYLNGSVVGAATRHLANAYTVAAAATASFLIRTQQTCSKGASASQRAGKSSVGALSKASKQLVDTIVRFSCFLQDWWFNVII